MNPQLFRENLNIFWGCPFVYDLMIADETEVHTAYYFTI